jgi:hypothetical protein
MSNLLKSILDEIPEELFRRVVERMTACSVVASQQALRTPPEIPTHRMRLGNCRYFERGEAIRLSADDVGLPCRYDQVNTHPVGLVLAGRFMIGHAKLDHWGDPIEDKDYKQELAKDNPRGGEQLPLWEDGDIGSSIFAVVVLVYPLPDSGQDESIPAKMGLGVPTPDLKDWHLLMSFDELFAAYADHKQHLTDKARPRLRRDQQQTHEPDS